MEGLSLKEGLLKQKGVLKEHLGKLYQFSLSEDKDTAKNAKKRIKVYEVDLADVEKHLKGM